MLRGGILMSIGIIPESLSQQILAVIILVGRLGVPWILLPSAPFAVHASGKPFAAGGRQVTSMSCACYVMLPVSERLLLHVSFADSEELFLWSGWNFPAWCSRGRRPLIAGCVSLQRLGFDLHVNCPAWDSNLRPPASESRP